MNDVKTPIIVVIALGAFAAIWWFGWFGPVTEMFQGIRENTVSPEDTGDDSQDSFSRSIWSGPDE
jgi:hypothetical protein